jgi:hypothetical protein
VIGQPARPLRDPPPPKPPPPPANAAPHPLISQLTAMRADVWRVQLQRDGAAGFAAKWPGLAAQILEGMRFGVPVDFVGDRAFPGRRAVRNKPVSAEQAAKIRAVIDADVVALKKAGPFESPPLPNFVVSPVGCVPKKDPRKIRVIHNLSHPFEGASVNAGISGGDEPLVLSSFGHAARAVRMLGRGCWLVKLDVEAAYKQVPVRPGDWHLLGFQWEGKWYYERVLPFGLKSSCRLWELYAAALHHFFQRHLYVPGGRIVIHYVDDFLFVVRLEASAVLLRDGALSLCARLGVPMATEKTEGPTTRLTFLGIELDTIAMRASLSSEKRAELHELTLEWGRKSRASVLELQSLAGKLQFACAVVRPGRFYLRRIIDHTTRVRRIARSDTAQFPITKAVLADIAWWIEFLPKWEGHSLLYEREWEEADRIELFTDACNTGYGAVYGSAWLAGRWPANVLAMARRRTRLSMPFLELYALVMAAMAWGHLWTAKKITFRCDCMPVVAAITRGSSRRPEMMHLLRLLAERACLCGFDFRCEHIPGVANTIADVLSRFGDSPQFRALRPRAGPEATPDHLPLPALPDL